MLTHRQDHVIYAVVCHQHTIDIYKTLYCYALLSTGQVCIMNTRGSRTEPCGAPDSKM